MLNQILNDRTALHQHDLLVAILFASCSGGGDRGFDRDNGRFAKRVDFLEFGGREHFLTLEGFEIIREGELFEEPENALGARFLEPVPLRRGGRRENFVH